MTFTDIVDKIDKSLRNGTTMHMPAGLVRALMTSPAYLALVTLKIEELAKQWGQPPIGEALPSEAPAQVAGDPVASGGMAELAEAAVRRRALADMAAIENPRKKRKVPRHAG